MSLTSAMWGWVSACLSEWGVTPLRFLIGAPLLLAIFLEFILPKLTRVQRLVSAIPDLPGRRPILGHVGPGRFEANHKGSMWLVDAAKEAMRSGHASVVLRAGPVPIVTVCDPRDAHALLKVDSPKSFFYSFLHRWMGMGLLNNTGTDWKRKRRMITPAFHFRALEAYAEVFERRTEAMLRQWRASKTGTVDVQWDITLVTLDSIGECAFGIEFDSFKSGKGFSPFTEATLTASKGLTERVGNPLLMNQFIYDISGNGRRHAAALEVLHDFSRRTIQEREDALKAGAPPRDKFFIDVLLAASDADGKHLTFQEINDEVDTFLFEGHDTTSSGIMWTLYCLATHRDLQDRCAAEVRAALAARGSCAEIGLDDVPLLAATIRESHRVYPPVPAYGRQVIVDTHLPTTGKIIPAGAEVLIFPLAIHRSEKLWGDTADEFIAERFLRAKDDDDDLLHDEELTGLKNRSKDVAAAKSDASSASQRAGGVAPASDSFAYIPFSAGPRGCIGRNFALLEERVVLCKILNEFTFEVEDGFVPKPVIEMVLRNEGPMNMKFSKRV